MAYPIPIQTAQKPAMTWAHAWTQVAGLVPVGILVIGVGAVAALVPTVIVWTYRGAIEAGTLVFWCKWGMVVGAALGGVFVWYNGLGIWREARGQRVAVDPEPFEQAAWASFHAWLVQGGHRTAHADGHRTVTFLVPWKIKDGEAVVRYGHILEGDANHSGGGRAGPPRTRPSVAWIPSDIAVPDPKERAAYCRQKEGYVAVRIGPFAVGTAHALLALEQVAAGPAPRGPLI